LVGGQFAGPGWVQAATGDSIPQMLAVAAATGATKDATTGIAIIEESPIFLTTSRRDIPSN
jgi:hypothetical protein